jgi:predicted PurR-regulated permease PerM
MNLKLTPGRVLGATIAALSVWIVQGFIEALLAACVIAIATWPLYVSFRARLPRGVGDSSSAAIFTAAISVFLLAPMVYACWSLLREGHMLLQGLVVVDGNGVGLPGWLVDAPVLGPWLATRLQQQLNDPSGLLMQTRHTDPGAVLGWALSLGEFTFRHALIVVFTILLLGFLYQEGGRLARELMDALRQAIGNRAERYVEVGTSAVRASAQSMLAVGLFDCFATALAYAAAGAPRPLVWAGITGALAAVPFLGYAAVAALALQLSLQAAPTTALLALLLGSAVLLSGDKLVRPMVMRGGMRLPFVWVLMGCIGGFGVLGLAGLVMGPVILSLVREMWDQRARNGAR